MHYCTKFLTPQCIWLHSYTIGLPKKFCVDVRVHVCIGKYVLFVRVLLEPILADTCVTVDGIHTLSPMLTLVLQTVIVVLLTVLPHITWQTLAPTAHTHGMYWTSYNPCIAHHVVSEFLYLTL